MPPLPTCNEGKALAKGEACTDDAQGRTPGGTAPASTTSDTGQGAELPQGLPAATSSRKSCRPRRFDRSHATPSRQRHAPGWTRRSPAPTTLFPRGGKTSSFGLFSLGGRLARPLSALPAPASCSCRMLPPSGLVALESNGPPRTAQLSRGAPRQSDSAPGHIGDGGMPQVRFLPRLGLRWPRPLGERQAATEERTALASEPGCGAHQAHKTGWKRLFF